MSKHTPSPWKLVSVKSDSHYGFKQIISEPTGWFIADIAGNAGLASIPTIESEANAKLIAAAPDLLENLEMICKYVSMREFDINVLRTMIDQSNETIKKATI